MEGAILNTLSFLEDIDFGTIFQLMGFGLILFWFVIVGWAVVDAAERFSSKWARLGAIILVVVIPLFGFLIYLVVRPRTTRDEEYWADLERRFLKFEAAGLEDCPSCGYELMPNFVYCPNCSRELRVKCESCEVYIEPSWNSCPFCGEPQEKNDLAVAPRKRTSTAAVPDLKPSFPSTSEKTASPDSPKTPKTPSRRKKSVTSGLRKIALKADGFVQMVGAIPLKLIPKKNGEKEKIVLSAADIPSDNDEKKPGKKDSKKSSFKRPSKAKRRKKK